MVGINFEDWEQRKLISLGNLNRGKSKHRPRNDPKLYGGEYPFVQTGDVAKAGLFLNSYKQTYSEFGIQQSKLWDKGTLLITIAANIAETSILSIQVAFPDSVIGFESNQVDMVFLKNVIDNASNTLKSKVETSSQANLNLAKLSELNVNVPSLSEQAKIGELFTILENAIALHQDKLDKLKQLKKGYLQVMFPEKDEKIPSLRFAHLFSVWEQRKFKDFITKAGKKNSKGLDYPAYSVNNKLGLVSQKEQFDGSRLEELAKTAYKIVEPDEFAYNPARINIGSIAFNHLNKTVIVSSLYVVLKMSKLLNDEYILQFVNSPEFITEVKRNTEGSVREYLFFESFKNIRFPYTNNLEEQKKLGSFFKQLDGVITLHQKKISNLQKLKKVYLQKLFV